MQANKQYPYPLSKVTRSSWRPEQGYWAIDFKDEDEDYGKFYLVNGRGKDRRRRHHSGRPVLLTSFEFWVLGFGFWVLGVRGGRSIRP